MIPFSNMKTNSISLLILSLLMATGTSLFAQSETIRLWQGEAPGAKVNPSYKTTVDDSGGWVKMRFVTNPTLDVYPAPANLATGTAVIICPGGAYWALAIKHEGSDVAHWLNSIGVTAFVLKYRLPDDSIMTNKSIGPMEDGQRAIRIVRRNARKWHIDPDRIGIMGFSAGGHLAATLSTRFNDDVYTPAHPTSIRPDFSILVYPVISMEPGVTHLGSRINLLGNHPSPAEVRLFSNELQVTAKTPPTFIVQSADDPAVPVECSLLYAGALIRHHVPCELHIYQSGGHGYGLGRTHNTESTWPTACANWLRMRGLLTKPAR